MRVTFATMVLFAVSGLNPHNFLRVRDRDLLAATAASSIAQAAAPGTEFGHYLDIGGSKVYYEECGTGPSIVLLHDGLLHSITWDGVWAPLCEKFHVVRYDRRGYGRSEPAKIRYSPTEDLHLLLQHLKVENAIIAGNSSGASLAIEFTLAHPNQVDALMLIGPVVSGMGFTDQFEARAQLINAPLKTGDVKTAAENWSKDPYLFGVGQEAARKMLLDVLSANPQNLTHSSNLEISNLSAATTLSRIRVPTLILVGESDIPDVHAHAGAIEAGIPGAHREIIEGAGLYYFVLYPESEAKFFMKTEPVEIEIVKDTNGKVTQIIFESDKGDTLVKFSKL